MIRFETAALSGFGIKSLFSPEGNDYDQSVGIGQERARRCALGDHVILGYGSAALIIEQNLHAESVCDRSNPGLSLKRRHKIGNDNFFSERDGELNGGSRTYIVVYNRLAYDHAAGSRVSVPFCKDSRNIASLVINVFKPVHNVQLAFTDKACHIHFTERIRDSNGGTLGDSGTGGCALTVRDSF